MKKLLLLTATMTMAGISAFASTARLDALGNAYHIKDFQRVYAMPSYMHLLPESLEIEFGGAESVGSSAEGGFLKNVGDAKLGFFLGHGDNSRTVAASANRSFLGIENPFTVAYGMKAADMPWGVAFTYSTSDVKTKEQKQAMMNLAGSMSMGDISVGATLGLGNTATGSYDTAGTATLTDDTIDNDAKYTGTSMAVYGDYVMGDMDAYLMYNSGSEDIKNTTADDGKTTTHAMTLGFINTMKKEGADFFYGVAYRQTSKKVDPSNAKTDTTTLPVVVGIEADAATWLTLRGSVSQNVLLGSTKTTTATDSIAHNTTVAAGAGLKFNKSMLDMTLTMGGTGAVKADDIGGNAAFTYMF
jgi:hypothetical protein